MSDRARSLCAGNALVLDPDVIHSVLNPIDHLTGAIHVYGGDFVAAKRREWDAKTLHEGPYDFESSRRKFDDANAALGPTSISGAKP